MELKSFNLRDLLTAKEKLALALPKPITEHDYAYAYDEFRMGCSTCTGSCTSCYGSCQGAMKG